MTSRVIAGDCRAVLATLPAASVQCVVTSPPYYGLRDYGVAGQIGLEQSPDAYVAELVAVFREIRRVLADSGCVFLNLGDSYADKQLLMMPARVALALQADGWFLRSSIVWAKPNPMPESVTSRPTSAHEHVFLLSKRASYYYDSDAVREPLSETTNGWTPKADAPAEDKYSGVGNGHSGKRAAPNPAGRNLRNVWTIATSPTPFAHFATMPPDLAERCIKAGTSERGQCPHCAAPWARVVEREAVARTRLVGCGVDSDEGTKGRAGSIQSTTTGWQPTCACPGEHKPVPQTVLDPFAGAGTTLLVADRLGRNGVGIELNPDYARLARDRITDDAPLFASVALADAAD